MLGARLRFFPVKNEPEDIQIQVIRGDNVGLLAGISNHEFFWAIDRLPERHPPRGRWWSDYYGGAPAAE